MLTLYYKPTCTFSDRVIETALELGLELTLVDASFDEVVIKQMIDLGGKKQTPFLLDGHCGAMLYETKLIIEHLERNYSGPTYGNMNKAAGQQTVND